jgi:hypothetical protein
MVIDKATLDVLGLVMTVGGIVLSIVALVLSILFYRWADAQAKSSDKSLIELRAATEGLQQLVTNLRDESFSLLKTAYTDMGELAKFGVRRDAADHVVLTEPAAAPMPKQPAGVGAQISDEEIQRVSLQLGSHMMRRRGASFPEALAEAQRLINSTLDDADGKVLTTGEFAEKLKPYGFDVGEVAYALAVMAETGRAQRAAAD